MFHFTRLYSQKFPYSRWHYTMSMMRHTSVRTPATVLFFHLQTIATVNHLFPPQLCQPAVSLDRPEGRSDSFMSLLFFLALMSLHHCQAVTSGLQSFSRPVIKDLPYPPLPIPSDHFINGINIEGISLFKPPRKTGGERISERACQSAAR